MKKIHQSILIMAIALITILGSTSCKKGSDDPVVSLKTRKDRFTNTWTLTKYEKMVPLWILVAALTPTLFLIPVL